MGRKLSLGIDIGSTTTKLVLIDGETVLYEKYQRHLSRVRQSALEFRSMTRKSLRRWRKEAGSLSIQLKKEGEYSATSLLFSVATRGISGFDAADKNNMLLRDIVNAYQTEYIKELAEKGPCVIVGRSADYILKGRENCLHIFIHGDLVDRAKRVVNEHGIDPAEAEKHVLERDKKRAKYYRHITDQVWGLAENYDLCLNSSKLGVDGCVNLILDCCK